MGLAPFERFVEQKRDAPLAPGPRRLETEPDLAAQAERALLHPPQLAPLPRQRVPIESRESVVAQQRRRTPAGAEACEQP
jgi:hypothetical protein